MRSSTIPVLSAALAAIPFTSAQTYTSCNPLKKTTCSSDTGLNQDTFSSDFSSSHSSWKTTAGTIDYTSSGAEFTINKKGDAPTIETDFYIFFGLVEVKMKAASGTGIVSSIVMESDDLDEIDWEFLGGNTTSVETNYFGKGNTTSYDRAIYYSVSTPQTESHTYSVNWTSSKIDWIIDGTTVRTLEYADANGGDNFPQTPMRIKLGIWAGGDPDNSEGTIEWAGGETTYSDGPFTMYVETVSITNYNPGKSYKYSDKTGSWQSIEILDTISNSTDGSSTSSSVGNSTTSDSGSANGTSTGSAANGTSTESAANGTSTESAANGTSTENAASAVSSVQVGAAAEFEWESGAMWLCLGSWAALFFMA